jgi:hypothetical protein
MVARRQCQVWSSAAPVSVAHCLRDVSVELAGSGISGSGSYGAGANEALARAGHLAPAVEASTLPSGLVFAPPSRVRPVQMVVSTDRGADPPALSGNLDPPGSRNERATMRVSHACAGNAPAARGLLGKPNDTPMVGRLPLGLRASLPPPSAVEQRTPTAARAGLRLEIVDGQVKQVAEEQLGTCEYSFSALLPRI